MVFPFKNVSLVQRKATKLENPGLKISFLTLKLKTAGAKIFHMKLTRNHVGEIGHVKF